MPLRDYVAELRVHEDGSGTSTVVWTADFEVTSDDEDATAGMIAQFLDPGVEALRRQYA